MNQEYQQQAQRLEQLRRAQQGQQYSSAGISAAGGGQNGFQQSGGYEQEQPLNDPLIFPGVYAPSGFNIMDILVKIHTRPNPTIKIGNIDHSVALTLCDSEAPDMPIVYCSEPFELLSGYPSHEILGRNCRFLQSPPTGQHISSKDAKANEVAKRELREKIRNEEEASVQLINFTRDGRRFLNVLTTIPIVWEGGRKYIVGFQADARTAFG